MLRRLPPRGAIHPFLVGGGAAAALRRLAICRRLALVQCCRCSQAHRTERRHPLDGGLRLAAQLLHIAAHVSGHCALRHPRRMKRRTRSGGSRPIAAVCLVCGEPTCGHRRARAAWGAGTSVRPRRSALRADFAAVLGLGARRPLSSARFARCARRRRVSGGCALRAPPPALRSSPPPTARRTRTPSHSPAPPGRAAHCQSVAAKAWAGRPQRAWEAPAWGGSGGGAHAVRAS